MSPSVASLLEGAKSIISSVAEGAKPVLAPVLRAAEPVISSAAEITQSGVSSGLRAAAPLARPFNKWLLKSPNPAMRRLGVEKLSGSKRASDTELVFARLQDPSPQVRCAAVRVLARIKTPANLSSLVAALQDESFEVREAAARALGSFGNISCAPALAGCLKDPDAAVRIAAAGALRSLGWRPSTRDELAWFEITLANTPAPTDIESVLADADPNQGTSFFRRLAEEELRESIRPGRVKALRAQLRGGDLLGRVSAIHDLAQIKEPEITEELLRLFRHQDPQMRLAAAEAMALREDSPPGHFLSLLRDPSAEVRLVAVRFLGRIRHEHIAQVLSEVLSDENPDVRQAAAAALS